MKKKNHGAIMVHVQNLHFFFRWICKKHVHFSELYKKKPSIFFRQPFGDKEIKSKVIQAVEENWDDEEETLTIFQQ